MRGKREDFFDKLNEIRNIPAYAGKTVRTQLPPEVNSEHPRVCGKTLSQILSWSHSTEHPRVCGENPP